MEDDRSKSKCYHCSNRKIPFDHKICCDQMYHCLEECRLPIKYSAVFREYYLQLTIKRKLKNQESFCTIPIFYCPWCGDKFEESLRDFYKKYMQKIYHLTPDMCQVYEDPRIPKEFKSNEWWKNKKFFKEIKNEFENS